MKEFSVQIESTTYYRFHKVIAVDEDDALEVAWDMIYDCNTHKYTTDYNDESDVREV